MPEIEYRYVFFRQNMSDGLTVVGSLGFPDLARLAAGRPVPSELRKKTAELLHKSVDTWFFRHTFPVDIQTAETRLGLDPPRESPFWTGRFGIAVHYVWWPVDPRLRVAFVPGWNVYAVATGGGKIEHAVNRECRNALMRSGATTNLSRLLDVTRFGPVELIQVNETTDLPTPRQLAETELAGEKTESTLHKITRPLVADELRPAWFVAHYTSLIAQRLITPDRSSVLLVGPAGVGKTAAFHQLVRDPQSHSMASYEFTETDGSRLIAGMSGFGQWQKRCTDLVEELEKRQVVIHFGNLVELIESGRGAGSSQGIADFLRPWLLRGKIQAIAECTPEQLAIVNQQSPRLLDAFHQIRFTPPDVPRTGEILLEVAAHDRAGRALSIEPAAIATVNQLHARYATYSARPGRPVRFLRNLFDDVPPDTIMDPDFVTSAFARQTGLPRFMLSDDYPLALDETRQWFETRLRGQPRAIDLIVDLLAVTKSNLNRTGRPIASLMFIGPTGVGKTWMARALAEFMYGDEKKMVRFDMSEYQDPLGPARLIGGLGQGDGLLTGKIRDNPFTVLLLDEFEKANALVFDLLLQVLGEGRLTDGHGRTVDFSTCLIIMTSNLGVDSFRGTAPGFGAGGDPVSWEGHFTRKLQTTLRPEFFNRIDRIVPFAPLEIDAVKQIAERELDLVRQRFGIATRDIRFRIHPSVPRELARQGYDPRYGARPLKRHIQRQIVQPLARQLSRFRQTDRLQVILHAQKSGIHINVQRLEKGHVTDQASTSRRRESVDAIAGERRRIQQVWNSRGVARLENEIYRQQQLLAQGLSAWPKNQRDAALFRTPRLLDLHQKIEASQKMLDQIRQLADEILGVERTVARQELEDGPGQPDQWARQAEEFRYLIDRLVLELFLEQTDGADQVTLVLFSRHNNLLQSMIQMYAGLARRQEYQASWFQLVPWLPDAGLSLRETPPAPGDTDATAGPADPVLNAIRFNSVEHLLNEWRPDGPGCAIQFRGETCFQMLLPESGLHTFRESGKNRYVLVESTGKALPDYQAPCGFSAMKEFDQAPQRRLYDMDARLLTTRMEHRKEVIKIPVEDDSLQAFALSVETPFRLLLQRYIDTWS